MKQKQTFSLVSDTDVEKTCFLTVKLKLLMNSFNFSQFHEHIFRSSCLQIFFKIGTLKSFELK